MRPSQASYTEWKEESFRRKSGESYDSCMYLSTTERNKACNVSLLPLDTKLRIFGEIQIWKSLCRMSSTTVNAWTPNSTTNDVMLWDTNKTIALLARICTYVSRNVTTWRPREMFSYGDKLWVHCNFRDVVCTPTRSNPLLAQTAARREASA